MVLLVLGLGIIGFVVGLIVVNKHDEDIGILVAAVSIIFAIIALIMTFILGISISEANVIDEKISMYEEENTRIETQLAEMVKQYQDYEKETYTEFKSDSVITLVSLYPELKSDTLVAKQCEAYLANNEKIKSLKESKINAPIQKWWLYFGH